MSDETPASENESDTDLEQEATTAEDQPTTSAPPSPPRVGSNGDQIVFVQPPSQG